MPGLLTEQQRLVRDQVRQFAARELAPFAAEWDRQSALPESLVPKLACRRSGPPPRAGGFRCDRRARRA